MKIKPRCFECLLSRVEFESRLSTDDRERIERVTSACRALLREKFSPDQPAPRIASTIHRLAYQLLDDPDPYAGLKASCNAQAIQAAERIGPTLHTLRDHIIASVIANTFDYGVQSHEVTDDFLRYYQEKMKDGLAIDDIDGIAQRTARIVYFTDNCGEIVMDALLIRCLKERGSRVTLAVKGAPILNDATCEDARLLGLDRVVDRLTTTGSGDIGVTLEKAPEDLADALQEATLVIAKGMANYESLTEYADLPPTAYLMAVKCDTIAESVGVPRGSLVAMLVP
ncbi:MAG: ARMT1-like domain-containing protein [Methanomicrobiales archaeon]|nr:ARMT1-like domain-containing protein [Methanomicrobiales archaeon]MDI6875225.1 ARMT1-like domain-containing protein [Methanomicrobiales archaeon]